MFLIDFSKARTILSYIIILIQGTTWKKNLKNLLIYNAR